MKVLVLGATGMLGHTVCRYLSGCGHHIVAAARSAEMPKCFTAAPRIEYVGEVNVLRECSLMSLFETGDVDIVINCVGVIKQRENADSVVDALAVNSLLPHRLAAIAIKKKFRLITVSTDCVFDGATGSYTEDSKPNSQDLYGISKRLGEVSDNSNVLTIRTSIIGPELSYHASILDWFLGQTGSVSGFTNAFFSGVTTLELSKIIQSEILHRENVSGLYQIASERISKFQLLTLFNDLYNRNIEIKPSSDFKIDRSLSAKKFFDVTGYKPPSWVQMIKEMKSYG